MGRPDEHRTGRRPRRRALAMALGALLGVCAALIAGGCGGDHGGGRTPTTTSSEHAFNGRWPGADWRPYADSSPFNRPVSQDDRVHARSSAIVGQILSYGPLANLRVGNAGTPDDYQHPVYFARAGDPAVRLQATRPWGPNPLDGMEIRIPRGASPAGGTDGHLAVVQPDGWEVDLWQAGPVPGPGGTLRFSWGSRLRIDGSGIGGEATAAGFGLLAGAIRPEELAAGRIDHALFLVVRCTSDTLDFGPDTNPHGPDDAGSSYVPPARKGGDRCPPGVRDAPPMGARLWLDLSDDEIRALRVPPWKRAIITALAHYGGFIGDTGGPGFGVMTVSGASYTAYGAPDPWVQLARRWGLSQQPDGTYELDLGSGVDWGAHLRVLEPPRTG